MKDDQKVSDNGTFIFEPADLEQFDQFSLTAVINEVTDSLEAPAVTEQTGVDDAGAELTIPQEFNDTICQLLEEMPSGEDSSGANGSSQKDDAREHGDRHSEAGVADLIDPSLLLD